MKIAVVGAGNIGGTLGAKWAQAGHEVVFGVRDPASFKTRHAEAAASRLANLDSIAAALAVSELILLAVPGNAVEALVMTHSAGLRGKIVIDATNNVRAAEMSAVAVLTAHVSPAQIYRAFNSLGWENFAQPVIGGLAADMFYCGPEAVDMREKVEQLISAVGLRPVYVGGLEQVAVLDNLTRLWFALAQKHGRHLAFKMLTP